jgi:hypothetical protein
MLSLTSHFEVDETVYDDKQEQENDNEDGLNAIMSKSIELFQTHPKLFTSFCMHVKVLSTKQNQRPSSNPHLFVKAQPQFAQLISLEVFKPK